MASCLLVRERQDGGWTMPGGWADVGDVPSEAAEREAWEEAGFHVKARRVIGVYDANRVGPLELFHAFKIVFLCDLIDGEARPSSETSEVAFFGPQEIPLIFRSIAPMMRHIEDAFRIYECPESTHRIRLRERIMLITNATLITWEEQNQVLPDHAVLIRDGRIAEIGPQAERLARHPRPSAGCRGSTSCRGTSAPHRVPHSACIGWTPVAACGHASDARERLLADHLGHAPAALQHE